MDQYFISHPVLVNYEASRDGVIRNRRLKKTVGRVNNMGYLMFGAGGKKYLCHRTIYECFCGLIEDGFVVDHKNGMKTDNSISNLQAVTQNQNTKFVGTGKHANRAKNVKSFDT